MTGRGIALPAVSVVVAARNAAATLPACLDSLLALDYPANLVEILVVDNASTDGTAKVLASCGERVRPLFAARRGASAARNVGVRAARHATIAFTDADCIVEPGWLTALVAPLADPAVGIAGGRILALGSNGIGRFGEQIHDHRAAIEEYRPAYAITMSWASPRAVLEAVGLFDEALLRGQDAELAYRIGQAGHRLAYVDTAVVRHRNRATHAGLFREGYLHGRGSVLVNGKHRTWLSSFGHRRVNLPSWRRLAGDLKRSVIGPAPAEARCWLAFNAGKKLGKLVGSLAALDLDL